MILGYAIPSASVVAGGIVLLLLLTAQMLVGTRRIHFNGRMHQKVHRAIAWTLYAFGIFHGLVGTVYALGLRIG